MEVILAVGLCVLIFAVIRLSKKGNTENTSNQHNQKEAISEEKLGEIIASLAFIRFQDDLDKDVQRYPNMPFMLPEKIHYYNDLMYVCTIIHLLNGLPQSVDLDNVATSAIIHLQHNHISCLTYLVVHNNSEDAASQVISDYKDMFYIVEDALETKSPFILGGVYRDHVIQNSVIFNELNEGLKITQMVTSWINDAVLLLERYTIT